MTRLTRDTALALILRTAIDPSMWRMILVTIMMITTAAHRLRPIMRKDTKNTATEGGRREEERKERERERGREGGRKGGREERKEGIILITTLLDIHVDTTHYK